MLLALDTGIRPGEAVSLKEEDFDLKHLTVTIPAENAKTRAHRSLPITPSTAEVVRKLLRARHPEWENKVPVFATCEGEAMKRCTWSDRMRMYSKKLGTKIRGYDLRHSFSLIYLRNGGNAFGLQKTLGHADMQMTRKYVNLSGQDLRESHTKASPLNTLLPKKNKQRVRKIYSEAHE